MPHAAPIHITTDRFEAEVLDSDLPAIVDFWAPWCGPCRAIGPALDTVAARYAGKVRVFKVNVDQEPGLAAAFQVRGIPMVVGMRGRDLVDVQVGFRDVSALDELAGRLERLGPVAEDGPPARQERA